MTIAIINGNDQYVEFFENLTDKTNITVININEKNYTEILHSTKIHLLVFTGGADVFPDYYGEDTGKFTNVNRKRDEFEVKVYYDLEHIPKVGICRGAQFLTVMNGGKLIQHVTGHTKPHNISVRVAKNSSPKEFKMTSTHHQMMLPFGMAHGHYELIAWSTQFQSTTYLDGKNKEIKLKNGDFLEPEIVYYHRGKSLAIQGHPEFADCDEATKQLCKELILTYLF